MAYLSDRSSWERKGEDAQRYGDYYKYSDASNDSYGHDLHNEQSQAFCDGWRYAERRQEERECEEREDDRRACDQQEQMRFEAEHEQEQWEEQTEQ